jgi:hypothetical protein
MDAALKERGECCEVWVQPGNLPGLGVTVKGQDIVINDDAVTALSRPAIRRVVIAARWSSYLKGKPEDHNHSPRIVGAETPEQAQARMADGLNKAFTKLQGPTRQIALVYPVPEAGIHVPYMMARKIRAGGSVTDLTLEKPAGSYAERHDLAGAVFDEMCGKFGLLPVRPDQLMIHTGTLKISRGDLALYLDDDHLSRAGSEPLVLEILARFTP